MMRFIPPAFGQPSGDRKKASASEAFIKAQKGGNTASSASAMSYDDILKAKMEEVRNDALKGAKYSFHLDGTDAAECRQLSKSAQEVIQKVAEKRAKKAEKNAKKADIVAIQAKYFTGIQGGRIDNKGRIFDAAGQEVMSVDKKTGKIKNKFGSTVGKYNPNSPMSEHKICRLIDKYSTKKDGVGSIWGSGGGNVWGGGDDSSNNWW